MITRAGRWSLAARLAGWYAATAFLLVTAAALLQYRALVNGLVSEDDHELVERLEAVRSMPSPTTQAIEPNAREGVRVFSETCRPLGAAVVSLPQPLCPPSPQASPRNDTWTGIQYRNWRSPSGAMWRFALVHARDPGSGWIEAFMDRSTDENVLRTYRNDLALILSASLLGALLLGYGIARHGLRPLHALRERMTRVDARSLDHRLGAQHAPAEIEALVGSFDAMLDRLEGAFKALSELSAELAHELRTPLHILRQQTEVALAHARSAEAYREVMISSLEEMQRLGRMADDMLFLARSEDPRASIDTQSLVVAAELADVAEYLEALAAENAVAIEVDAPANLRVAADRMLLRRALVNVVVNAIRHAPTASRVRLIGREDGDSVVVCVEDTGAGIALDALPRVFDRYFRAPDTRGGSSDGSGLGLAIVRGIMQLHGGTATVVSAPGQGTRVTLAFPQRRVT